MNGPDFRGHPDIIGKLLAKRDDDDDDGRFYGLYIGRITNHKDPARQRRVKAEIHFLQDEQQAIMETDWLTELAPFAGPTDKKRKRQWGMEWPIPEKGSLVAILFNAGDPHDGYWFATPRYDEGLFGNAEMTTYEQRHQWLFRMVLPNGWEWGVDAEGNEYKVTPGNYRHKGQGAHYTSARGVYSTFGTYVRTIVGAVNRLIAVSNHTTQFPEEDEWDEVNEMILDAIDGAPGRKFTPIPKIDDLDA